MKLSKFTVFFSIYLVASAAFMRQAWDLCKDMFGKDILILSFILLCCLTGSAILYKSMKSGLGIKRTPLIIAICALGFLFAWKQPYLPEKAHILEYGLLAWLTLRDLSKNNRAMPKNIASAFIFVSIIGSLDEGFQGLLPWRYFELRDILTNMISGIIGIALFILQSR